MKAPSAPLWLLSTSSSFAGVVGKGVFDNAADTDSWTRTLEFLRATLH